MQKSIKSNGKPLEFIRHQHFFTRNKIFLIYEKIRIKSAFQYVSSNYFDFWQSDCNFDGVYNITTQIHYTFLKYRYFQINVLRFSLECCQENFITWLRSNCRSDQVIIVSKDLHFYRRSYHNFHFMLIWLEKTIFLEVVLLQLQNFRIGTRYDLKISQQFRKEIKANCHKKLRDNSYSWRSYRGKTYRRGLFYLLLPSWIELNFATSKVF